MLNEASDERDDGIGLLFGQLDERNAVDGVEEFFHVPQHGPYIQIEILGYLAFGSTQQSRS